MSQDSKPRVGSPLIDASPRGVTSVTSNAVLSSKYPQPPFTLLQYHIVPTSLDRESSLLRRYESKIDTLLPGHPLVVTTLSKTQSASINGIEIKQWELYNDGHVIIHGIQDFFDPGFQVLEYPWYDNAPAAATNNQKSNTTAAPAPTTRDYSETVAAAKFKKLVIILVVVVTVVLVVLAYAVLYLCYHTSGRQRLQE